jgi:hypothetical protein
MDNTMNQVGVSAINAAPIAQQPVAQPLYNKAIGSPMGVQRTPADPTGQVSNAVATDLNFNPNTKDMALMMYGGNKSRGIK